LEKKQDEMPEAIFGPGGNADAFYAEGYKNSLDMPKWLAAMGLGAYEYQCSRGANVKEQTAAAIGRQARLHKITLSIHAPYYISLATEDEQIVQNTQNHFLKTMEVAKWMGADRIVFHMGGPGKLERSVAMTRVQQAFAAVLEKLEQRGLTGIFLCPETMGKQNQLGTLEEVLTLCRMSEQVIPAVDFGHMHAVSGGQFLTCEEFERVFDRIGTLLKAEIANNLHVHFSRIEFTRAGEKCHRTLSEPFGPPHEPFLEVCARRGFTPRIICESAGTQAKDALLMQGYYRHRKAK
jgi:deoxyribonuclease-4